MTMHCLVGILALESLSETSWFRAKKKSQSNFRWNEVILAAMVRWHDERGECFYAIRTRRLGTDGRQVRFRVVVTNATVHSSFDRSCSSFIGNVSIDVACGPGYVSAAVRELSAIPTGIDFSEKMVAT